jgi:dethiobiotin synthetase
LRSGVPLSSTSRVFVVGTGTDVGKTHVASALARAAREAGLRVAAWKPFATGCATTSEDAERLAEGSGSPVVPAYLFRDPVSPHLAARREGKSISLEVVVARAHELGAEADFVVIEGAGGLFSPITDDATHVELARLLAPCALVLVTTDRLGVLHDVKAARVAAHAEGLELRGVVLSAPACADSSTGSNAAELERLGLGPVLAEFPRAGSADPATLASGRALLEALRRAPFG